MFIIPLSLFLVTTYLRPRTQAELSYIITAIECLSGLWCLLFAPFQIQLSLVGLFLLRNASSLQSRLNRNRDRADYLDLSNGSSPAIDVEAELVESRPLSSPHPSPTEQQQSAKIDALPTPTLIPTASQNTETSVTTLATPSPPQEPPATPLLLPPIPKQDEAATSQGSLFIGEHQHTSQKANQNEITALQSSPSLESQADNTPVHEPFVEPDLVVQMRYRGSIYFKIIPKPSRVLPPNPIDD